MNTLDDHLFTLDICRKHLPADADPVHAERLREIAQILRWRDEAQRRETIAHPHDGHELIAQLESDLALHRSWERKLLQHVPADYDPQQHERSVAIASLAALLRENEPAPLAAKQNGQTP